MADAVVEKLTTGFHQVVHGASPAGLGGFPEARADEVLEALANYAADVIASAPTRDQRADLIVSFTAAVARRVNADASTDRCALVGVRSGNA